MYTPVRRRVGTDKKKLRTEATMNERISVQPKIQPIYKLEICYKIYTFSILTWGSQATSDAFRGSQHWYRLRTTVLNVAGKWVQNRSINQFSSSQNFGNKLYILFILRIDHVNKQCAQAMMGWLKQNFHFVGLGFARGSICITCQIIGYYIIINYILQRRFSCLVQYH